MATPNPHGLLPWLRRSGMSDEDIRQVFQTFNAAAPDFAAVAGGRDDASE